jgi:hypothetical protein
MSVFGDLIKAGISSDGANIDIFSGTLQARNVWVPKGNVYYVDKDRSASGSGLSWSTAFKTIAEAITVMNARITWSNSPWAEGDICFIAPGTYAENLTSLPYGCMLVGAGHDMRDAQFGTKIKPASGSPVDVGAAINSKFLQIGFESADTSAAFDADILNNCMFQDCYFTGPAETSTMAACIVTKDAVMNKIFNCIFSCADKGIDVNYADGGDSFSHNKIIDCMFDQIDTAGIEISTNLVGPSSLVKGCSFHGAGVTMAIAIDDNSAILDVDWCTAESTSGFSGCRSVNGSYNNGALVT